MDGLRQEFTCLCVLIGVRNARDGVHHKPQFIVVFGFVVGLMAWREADISPIATRKNTQSSAN